MLYRRVSPARNKFPSVIRVAVASSPSVFCVEISRVEPPPRLRPVRPEHRGQLRQYRRYERRRGREVFSRSEIRSAAPQTDLSTDLADFRKKINHAGAFCHSE